MIEPVETMNRRPLAAVSLADLPRQLRADADEMNGWSAGNEAEHARQAADEIERLRAIIAMSVPASAPVLLQPNNRPL